MNNHVNIHSLGKFVEFVLNNVFTDVVIYKSEYNEDYEYEVMIYDDFIE